MKQYFLDIVAKISKQIADGEKFTASFSGESLDYARFNEAKIRQAGSVDQQYLELDLIINKKHASINLGLCHDLVLDQEKITQAVKLLREHCRHSAEDPYLMIHEGNHSSESIAIDELPEKTAVVETLLKHSRGLDAVGCYYGGPIYKGFANSFGQVNWFQKSSFVLDASFYHSGDKAVKQSLSDTRFHEEQLLKKIEQARRGLSIFAEPSQSIARGSYRVYFAPAAVQELLTMINWGGFSRKSLEVKSSPLVPLASGHKTMSPLFSLSENIAGGVGANFQAQGFMKPSVINIIEKGSLKNTLISPKTAQEYRLDHNGADDEENLTSMDMAPGDLAEKDIMSALGDGLYINNLWYLNFSDRHNGWLTGMTRFFCYLVKNGQAKAPFSVMRFDDSIYRIFGENLRAATKERELLIDTSTYEERSTNCARLPGIIVDDVRFTL